VVCSRFEISAENVIFQVIAAASMMFRVVFWDILPCKMIVDRRFRGAYCLHHLKSNLSFYVKWSLKLSKIFVKLFKIKFNENQCSCSVVSFVRTDRSLHRIDSALEME
jgi:hypothetical protein